MLFTVRPARILSALMLITIVNVYVFANGALASSSKATFGRLVTTSNRPVLVNGGEAITGTVILSGSELSTSSVNMATVEVPNTAVVSIAPSSRVTLTFDAKNVTVKVAAGDAVLRTADGVTGTVVDAAGMPKPSGPVVPAGGNNRDRNLAIAGIAIGSGAFIWAILGWNKANNAQDDANAANAAAASLASQLAALRACLAKQTTSPVSLCTSF